MPHMTKVHEHLTQSTAAHRHTRSEALREAAIARAQAEAANAPPEPTDTSPGPVDDD